MKKKLSLSKSDLHLTDDFEQTERHFHNVRCVLYNTYLFYGCVEMCACDHTSNVPAILCCPPRTSVSSLQGYYKDTVHF